MSVRVAIPGGASISLGTAEAERLVGLLWDVSATRGAVVAIGRLNHGLSHGSQRHAIDLSDSEQEAVRVALEAGDGLPDGLSKLLRVVSPDRA